MKELILVGGSPAPGGDIYRYLAEKAKPEEEIGYIAFASPDPEPQIAKVAGIFADLGIKLRVISHVDDCYGLGVIYLGGGDQGKLVYELKRTGIDELLRPEWKKGNVILSGSSAGAMALFWDMLKTGEMRQSGRLDLIKGMGPMGGGLVVPHRNIAEDAWVHKLVRANNGHCIIGIDENTALRWRNGVCDVLGVGKVELSGRSKGVWRAGEEFSMMSTQ